MEDIIYVREHKHSPGVEISQNRPRGHNLGEESGTHGQPKWKDYPLITAEDACSTSQREPQKLPVQWMNGDVKSTRLGEDLKESPFLVSILIFSMRRQAFNPLRVRIGGNLSVFLVV